MWLIVFKLLRRMAHSDIHERGRFHPCGRGRFHVISRRHERSLGEWGEKKSILDGSLHPRGSSWFWQGRLWTWRAGHRVSSIVQAREVGSGGETPPEVAGEEACPTSCLRSGALVERPIMRPSRTAVWLAEPSAGSCRSGRLGEATLPKSSRQSGSSALPGG